MCLDQFMMALNVLNDVADGAESTKTRNNVIIASFKSVTMGKLVKRVPGSSLLISNLPGGPDPLPPISGFAHAI